LQFRLTEVVAALCGFAAAASLPPGSLSGEPGRLLTTFLGLLAASILPTVSLIVGGMSTGSRSVNLVSALGAEIMATVDLLFAVFGMIALTLVVLLLLNVPTPYGSQLYPQIPRLMAGCGQGIVGALAVLVVCKSGAIPGAIRRSLSVRTEMAETEAKKKTAENAIAAAAASPFKTQEGFGATVSHDKDSKTH
jgi:Zn-dependent protease